MATQEAKWHIGYIEPFWDDAHLRLEYDVFPFNNPDDITSWESKGYAGPFGGALCDMRKPQAWYTDQLTQMFTNIYGLHNVGTSFFRMDTGFILPTHKDTYKKYREIFNVEVKDIQRIIVFLEHWKPGHYFEIEGIPIVSWKRGDYIWWRGDADHMAANLGLDPRYTLQVTGHNGL